MGTSLAQNPDGTLQFQGLRFTGSLGFPQYPANISIPIPAGSSSSSDQMPTATPWITIDEAGHWDEWVR